MGDKPSIPVLAHTRTQFEMFRDQMFLADKDAARRLKYVWKSEELHARIQGTMLITLDEWFRNDRYRTIDAWLIRRFDVIHVTDEERYDFERKMQGDKTKTPIATYRGDPRTV